jgi:hypothetical protein
MMLGIAITIHDKGTPRKANQIKGNGNGQETDGIGSLSRT